MRHAELFRVREWNTPDFSVYGSDREAWKQQTPPREEVSTRGVGMMLYYLNGWGHGGLHLIGKVSFWPSPSPEISICRIETTVSGKIPADRWCRGCQSWLSSRCVRANLRYAGRNRDTGRGRSMWVMQRGGWRDCGWNGHSAIRREGYSNCRQRRTTVWRFCSISS